MKKRDMENYSRAFRNYINYQNKLNDKINPTIVGWKASDNYQELLAYITIKAMHQLITSDKISDTAIDDRSKFMRLNKVMMQMALLTIFVDMYKILNLREKLGIIDALDASLLEKMRNAEELDQIYQILLDSSNLPLIVQTFNFSELSIYDKVLQIKALDDKDLAFLRRIFEPFEVSLDEEENKIYQSEYEAYNVEVDEAFMMRQMKKWKDLWKDKPEKCYEDAANFLGQYSLLNNNLYERLLQSTGCTKSCDKKELLKKFYQSQ